MMDEQLLKEIASALHNEIERQFGDKEYYTARHEIKRDKDGSPTNAIILVEWLKGGEGAGQEKVTFAVQISRTIGGQG